MATPKPGEIRCPTCHRSTPPATFCTQCGSAIPPDARIRPRGMDRDELQERIRARRSGGEPYRRGAPAEDELSYGRFEPEPEDAAALRSRGVDPRRTDHLPETPAPVVVPPLPPSRDSEPDRRPGDLTREVDDWEPRPATPAPPPAPAYQPPPPQEPEYVDNFDEEAYDGEYGYDYDQWHDDRERRSGAGALAILGFLALGVLALLGGALLAGVFSDESGVGQGDATPSATVVASASAAASEAASAAPSGSAPPASQAPQPSGEPVVFADGFTAEAQPCLPGSADEDGCDSNGAVNSGATDIWIGFSQGTAEDVIGATLLGADGQQLAEGSIRLADINCGDSCQGYTRFNFSNLDPGSYTVEVTRNGQLADRITFEVQ